MLWRRWSRCTIRGPFWGNKGHFSGYYKLLPTSTHGSTKTKRADEDYEVDSKKSQRVYLVMKTIYTTRKSLFPRFHSRLFDSHANHTGFSKFALPRLIRFRNLDNQFPKLARVLHILKQSIDALYIVNTEHGPRDDRFDVVFADKGDHVCEFLAGAHGGAAEVDVLQDGGHEEGHCRGDGHAVGDYDAAGLQ